MNLQNLLLRVEIKSAQFKTRTTVNNKTFAEQQAGLHVGSDFPIAFRLGIEPGQPYEPGFYVIDPACFKVGEYGDLELGRVKLLPLSGAEMGATRPASK